MGVRRSGMCRLVLTGVKRGFSPFCVCCSNTLSSLVEESGCPLEHPKASAFRENVIAGKWDEVRSGC